MNELEKQQCSTAVAEGLALSFVPRDCKMLHLLGLLRSAPPDAFGGVMAQVCAYGEDRLTGFADTVNHQIKVTLKELEEASKLLNANQC